MKVYTKGGDKGRTSLIGGERVLKNDCRVEAYGSVDELIAFTALLADKLASDEKFAAIVSELRGVESQLMVAAALLAVGDGGADKVSSLKSSASQDLEQSIDRMQEALPQITKFTIPGGDVRCSLCHVCRTVCRRAERMIYRADRKQPQPDAVKGWINRLSDYFYLLGRRLSHFYGVEERRWIP